MKLLQPPQQNRMNLLDPIKPCSGFNIISWGYEGPTEPTALQLGPSWAKEIRNPNFRFLHLFSFCSRVIALVFLFPNNSAFNIAEQVELVSLQESFLGRGNSGQLSMKQKNLKIQPLYTSNLNSHLEGHIPRLLGYQLLLKPPDSVSFLIHSRNSKPRPEASPLGVVFTYTDTVLQ